MVITPIELPEGDICALADKLLLPGSACPIVSIDEAPTDTRTRLEARVMWVVDLTGNINGTVTLTEVDSQGDLTKRNIARTALDKYTSSMEGYLTMIKLFRYTLH